MSAAKAGQNGMLRSWLAKQTNKPTNLMMVAAQNNDGYNLFMLVLMHLETEVVQKMITTLDLGSCIDQRDREGNNALLLAAISEQWPVLKSVLSNNKLDELAIDIHPKTKDGHTTLVLVLAASVKISKQIQNYKMKNDKINEKKMEAEAELLWDIVKLLLEKERDNNDPNFLRCLQLSRKEVFLSQVFIHYAETMTIEEELATVIAEQANSSA